MERRRRGEAAGGVARAGKVERGTLVMSDSRWRMSSSFLGSVTTTCTPIAIFVLRRSMSSSAIFAFLTVRGIPCAARPP